MKKRVIAAVLAALMALSVLCMCGCDESVFDQYESDTFELGDN